MKKHKPYRLTPSGVRIPKHPIKWMPSNQDDSVALGSAPEMLSLPPQIYINSLNIFPRKTALRQHNNAPQIVDCIDVKEVESNDV